MALSVESYDMEKIIISHIDYVMLPPFSPCCHPNPTIPPPFSPCCPPHPNPQPRPPPQSPNPHPYPTTLPPNHHHHHHHPTPIPYMHRLRVLYGYTTGNERGRNNVWNAILRSRPLHYTSFIISGIHISQIISYHHWYALVYHFNRQWVLVFR